MSFSSASAAYPTATPTTHIPTSNESTSTTPIAKHAQPILLSSSSYTAQSQAPAHNDQGQEGEESEADHAAHIVAHQHHSHHLAPDHVPRVPILPRAYSQTHTVSHSQYQSQQHQYQRRSAHPNPNPNFDINHRLHSHPSYAYADQRDREEARSKVSLWRAGVRVNGEVSPDRGSGNGDEVHSAAGASAEVEATPTSISIPEAPKLEERRSDFAQAPRGVFAGSDVGSNDKDQGRSTGGSGSEDDRIQEGGMERCEQAQKKGKGACGIGKVDTQKKKVLAERMLDTMHELLCSTWPEACSFDSPSPSTSPDSSPCEEDSMSGNGSGGGLMPLRGFIREILRRSKSSCMTLKAAEWYLMRLRRTLAITSPSSPSSSLPEDSPLHCPRRAFLAALVLAHKFLHDRVYSNRAWAKASGLDICEVSKAELALGCMLDWRLWVGKGDEEVSASVPDITPVPVNVGHHSAVENFVTPPVHAQSEYNLASSFANAYTRSPSSINETAQSCSSSQSSPRTGFRTSRPASLLGGPVAVNALPASTFSSMGGSFASISPEAMHLHGRPSGQYRTLHHQRGSGSTISVAATALSLSASMPRLSIDGASSAWDTSSGPSSGISPEMSGSMDKTGEVMCVVHPPYHDQAHEYVSQDEDQVSGLYHLHPNNYHQNVAHHHLGGAKLYQDQSLVKCGTTTVSSTGGCRKRGALGCVEEERRRGSAVSGCGDGGIESGMSGVSLKRRKTINGSSVSTGSEYEGSPLPTSLAGSVAVA